MLEWNVPGGFLSVRSGKPDMASKYRSVELAKLKLTALFSVRRQTTLYSNSVSCTSGSQRRDFLFFFFYFQLGAYGKINWDTSTKSFISESSLRMSI